MLTSLFGDLGLTFPAQAILLARTFNLFQMEPAKRLSDSNFWALMFFIVALGNLGVYFTISFVGNRIQQKAARQYRLELFKLAISQEIDFFDKPENTTEALASRLSTYPTNLEELLGFNLGLVVIQVVNIVSSSILALIVGYKLGLVVVLGAMPVVVFFWWLRIRLQGKLDETNSERFSGSAGLAVEAVSAIRNVSSLTLEQDILGQYQDKLSGITVQSTKSYLWMMFWYSLTRSISFLAMALGFWQVDLLSRVDEINL
jgi:ATP-binding cassette subfamily B (MDR/TAP) protein 1